jgi:hypothetical protein
LSKIHDLSGILEDRKKKEQLKLNTRRVESLRRVLQCSLCGFRCPLCGVQLEQTDTASCRCGDIQSPMNLCAGCRAEFEDYMRSLSSGKEGALFWHTDEWRRFWASWLSYQEALLAFRKSKTIKMFTETLKEQL